MVARYSITTTRQGLHPHWSLTAAQVTALTRWCAPESRVMYQSVLMCWAIHSLSAICRRYFPVRFNEVGSVAL
jgi:hypothetical protein